MRYLISLREIGIEIAFAVEFGMLGNLSVECESRLYDQPDRLLIDSRERAGMPHTDGTDVDVGPLFVRIIETRTKHLGSSLELGMDLQANGRFVVHNANLLQN